jgi:hypothetical protein
VRLGPLVRAVPAARTGLVRALVGGYTLVYLGRRRQMFREVTRTDPALFKPVGPVRALRKPLPPPVADALSDATLVSTALFTLGAGHRVTGRLHSALLAWTLSYRNSWSMIYHSDNTMVLHTLVLGATRSADAVSVDALVRGGDTPADHPRYDVPLQVMNAASTAAYLLAGVAKVAGPSGWHGADGAGMRRQVAVDGVRKELFGSEAAPVGAALYRHKHLFTAMAAGSLVLELGAPLAMLDRRLGRAWVAAMFGLHWGIRAVMGITFRYQMSGVSFASWLEVERLLDLVRRRR